MGSVSVVIPAYNTPPEWLAEAITSAVEQEPAPLEVLVIDDGSDVPVTCTHPSVRVIRQDNAGVSAARNRGLRDAVGEYVAFLDSDDTWYPGKLAAQLPHMTDGVGLCSTRYDLLHSDGRVSPGFTVFGVDYRTLLLGSGISPSTALVRRDVLLAVGGFDESLSRGEDWDAWLRITRVRDHVHVPVPLGTYRQHEQAASRDYRAMWVGSMRVLWRHRRAVPLRGVRRQGQIYGGQAFDAFRATRRPDHLAWAALLWPDYVARQIPRALGRQRPRLRRQMGGASR